MAEFDIAPELSDKISKSYLKYLDGDPSIKRLEKLGKQGKATWADANEYALKHGEALVRAVRDNIQPGTLPEDTMYYNIASRVLPPNLKSSEKIIADYAVKVQDKMNKDAGYNILALRPKHNSDKVKGIVDLASSKPYPEIEDHLYEVMKNYDQSIVDETIHQNMQLLDDLGVYAMVTRIYDDVGLHGGKDPCQWCIDRAGTWTYDEANANGVFERHVGCGCVITYTLPNKNGGYYTETLEGARVKDSKTGKTKKTTAWEVTGTALSGR